MGEPPNWNGDSFSRYLRDAEFNDRATAANYPKVFGLLRRAHAAFEAAEAAFEKDGAATGVPRFLFVRSHSAYLAACRLGMSGQLTEALAVLRVAIECAWYGLHIAKDPTPYTRTEIWLRRNESASTLATCNAEFTVKNVSETHKALDASTEAELRATYGGLIDFGAHPNQFGVLATTQKGGTQNKGDYKVGILYPSEVPVLFTLRQCVAVAARVLSMIGLVYPERFAIMGLDIETAKLSADVDAVFAPYAVEKK